MARLVLSGLNAADDEPPGTVRVAARLGLGRLTGRTTAAAAKGSTKVRRIPARVPAAERIRADGGVRARAVHGAPDHGLPAGTESRGDDPDQGHLRSLKPYGLGVTLQGRAE
jgi:hypothetical protein